MTLRKSFWDVSGHPSQSGQEYQDFLEHFAPEAEYGHMHFVSRQQQAQHNYLSEFYPNMTHQDAILWHERNSRAVGDLKFRELPEKENEVYSVVRACQEFRNACQWWQNGERDTNVAVTDAQEFAAIAKKWEMTKWYDQDSDPDAVNSVKREVELSCQFAQALIETVEATKIDLNDGKRMTEQRADTFREKLENVFSTFGR